MVREREDNVQKKLDRCLISHDLKMLFQKLMITHRARISSDHPPIVIQADCSTNNTRNRVRPYRFEAIWLSSDECEEVVCQAWTYSFQNQAEQQVGPKIQWCGEFLKDSILPLLGI